MNQVGRLALIALGSNEISIWGNPTETIQKAMLLLEDLTGSKACQSRLYTTPAFPAGDGPDFVNAAVGLSTQMSVPDLLATLHDIEAAAKRARTQRWGQRTLDLDLIALGDEVTPDDATHRHWRDLPMARQMTETPEIPIVPHPRLQDRSFVLVPLLDIAPDWRHPVLGLTVKEMRAGLPVGDIDSVIPVL